jgi:ribonuclease P protein component
MAIPPASVSCDRAPGSRPGAPRWTLPAQARIRGRAEFDLILRRGARASDDYLAVWVARRAGRSSRLGLMIGRRHGGAVQRNRLKRLLREAFRLQRAECFPGLDLIVTARPGADLTLRIALQSLTELVRRAVRRLDRRPPA